MGSPTGQNQNFNNGVGGHYGFDKVPGDMGGANASPGYGWSQSHGNPGQPPMVQNPGMPQPGSPYHTMISGGGGGLQIQPGGPGVGWQQPQPGQYPGMLNPSQPPQQAVMPPPGPPQGAFQGLAQGTMGDMRGHVQAGNMGRAKQAYEAGGGTWNSDVHRRLKNKWG